MKVFKLTITALILAAVLLTALADTPQKEKQELRERRYGQANVSEFIKACEGLEFVCNIEDWHPIIGKEITVIIDRLQEPKEIGEDKSFYYNQLQRYLTQRLSEGEITLHNIKRADDRFAIVADVRIDDIHLAPELIRNGLAEIAQKPKQGKDAPETTDIKKPSEKIEKSEKTEQIQQPANEDGKFAASENSNVFHKISCSFTNRINKENLVKFETRQDAIKSGRRPCGTCNP